MNTITFSQSIEGYLLAANARRLSPNTINDYSFTLHKFKQYLGDDPPIAEISVKDVQIFLANQNHISKKTLLNYHTGLSALWTWCLDEELVDEHILHKVKRPKPEIRVIRPYTQAEVQAMLSVLKTSKTYTRPGKRECSHKLPLADRNKAIIYLLLDTGIRASELGNLRIHHVDVRNRRVTVMGKGSKQRTNPFSARTGQILWRYLALRNKDSAADYLFVTNEGRNLVRTRILNILRVIGDRAGVQGVNVHRFRHTFAINYLRNGGDPYSLQIMLGHSTMDMVKRYLSIAQADLDKSHKLASPVDNWRL
jgi:site-specific recombinase XerD